MKTAAYATLALTLAGCSWSAARPIPTPPAAPLIESRGVVMPLAQARSKISFTPIIPNGSVQWTAVIPPLGRTRTIATNGLAVEYQSAGARYVLSQWPRNGANVQISGVDTVHRPCAPIAYKADGLMWATRNGLVMTLQPDGAVKSSLLESQARRLLAAGHCRRSRILRSVRTRPRRVVFLLRQSVF